MVDTIINYYYVSLKGSLLYLARMKIIRVGQEVAGEIQKKIAKIF